MPMYARRLWFYGTWARVVLSWLLTVGLAALVVIVGIWSLWRRSWPLGVLLIVVGIAIFLALVTHVVRFRRDVHAGITSELKRRNFCPHCEYDLRASFNRCPECGNPISNTIEV